MALPAGTTTSCWQEFGKTVMLLYFFQYFGVGWPSSPFSPLFLLSFHFLLLNMSKSYLHLIQFTNRDLSNLFSVRNPLRWSPLPSQRSTWVTLLDHWRPLLCPRYLSDHQRFLLYSQYPFSLLAGFPHAELHVFTMVNRVLKIKSIGHNGLLKYEEVQFMTNQQKWLI